MFLVKSGGDGTLQWMQTYGGGGEDAALDVRECVDGGFVLAGMTYSYGRYGEAFLVKTDRDGAEEWHQNYPGDGPVQAVGVVAQNDGGYLLAGTCMTYQPNDVNGWLMKVEENGRQVWKKSFGGLREDIFLGMDAALDGGCFVCGYTYSMGAGGSDGWILKFDSAGKLVWEHPRGGSGYDKFYGVRATADGGCVAAGEKEGDAWLVKMDGNGL
jgi:hypothetical protein